MKITNRCNLPEPIVRAVSVDDYSKGESDFSVSGLIRPPQINMLEAMHYQELEEDASDRIWRLLGTSIHEILSKSSTSNALSETRLYAEINGVIISGQFDHMAVKDRILTDYKVTSAWAVKGEVKDEWEKQLNYYYQLCRLNDIDVDKLQIVAILRDWSRSNMARDPGYPQQSVVTLDVPLWPDDRAMNSMGDDIADQLDALAGNARPCTDSERWFKPGKVALMKKGRKSAVRLFDTRNELVTYCLNTGLMITDSKAYQNMGCLHLELMSLTNEDPVFKESSSYIQERPAVFPRCENYCGVSAFCEQWRDENVEAV